MLTDGQADDIGGSGKAEAIDGDIVRGFCDLSKGEVLEDVWLQGFSRRCCSELGSVRGLVAFQKSLTGSTGKDLVTSHQSRNGNCVGDVFHFYDGDTNDQEH